VVEIEKVADGKQRPFGAGAQPLSGIRALSFTPRSPGRRSSPEKERTFALDTGRLPF
jgi:hypothetical protein